MKKWIRILAVLIVAVAALGIGGVAILVAVDTGKIRDLLSEQVQKATGRALVINGDLNLAISLRPSVIANDVTFANAAWGSSRSMVSLSRLEVGLDLVPLLKGEIHFTNVLLVEPKILLQRRADGRGNWQFGPAKALAAPGGKPGAAPVIPRLGQVEIQNAKFTFKDQAKGQEFEITVKQLSLDGEDPSGQLELTLAGAFSGAAFTVAGSLGRLDLLAADPASYPIDLSIRALSTQISVQGSVGRPLSAPNFDLGLRAKGDDISATIDGLKAFLPGTGVPPVPKIGGFEFSGRSLGGPDDPRLRDIKFSLGTAEEFNITGGGSITGIARAPEINMRLAVNGSDLRPFSGLAGVDFPKGPGYMVAAALAIKPGEISVTDLVVVFGASKLKGSASLSLIGAVPAVQADLTSETFDLNDILAVLSKAEITGAPKPDTKRLFADDPLPLAPLKLVNGEVTLKAKRVVAGPAPINDLKVRIKINDGNLSLAPVSARISGGKLDANVTLHGAAPNLKARLKLKGLDLGALLKEMQLTNIVSGKLDGTVDLAGSGASVRAIMAGLDGRTEIVMTDGRIESKYVDLIAADLVRAIMPWAHHAKDTKINCLVSRFDIKNGIAKSTGLLFDTEKMTITGGGQINLRSEKLDMQIKPHAKDASLVSLSVPIDIGGTLKSPSARPSTAALVKGVAGLALTAINPLALLALTVSAGESDKNPCIAALEKARSVKPKTTLAAPADQKSGNPIEAISKGIGVALKSLFGK